MMEAIGNAVSGLGGGAVEIERVVRALGQMQAKGKVTAEEMMRLAELGIPVLGYTGRENWCLYPRSYGQGLQRVVYLQQKV